MPDSWITPALAEIRGRHEERQLAPLPAAGPHVTLDGKPFLNLASNDYLGLAGHARLVEAAAAAARAFGTGATASRLIVGTHELHRDLETELAAFKQFPAALTFGSGYLASIGCLPVLAGRNDLVLADRLAHACLLDGARLSGSTLKRFQHNDLDHLAALLQSRKPGARCLIVTESVFSMDGDLAPLPDLAALAQSNDAMLLVDDAHATGVFGPSGAGLSSAPDLRPHVTVSIGTFSKALGGYGGFVAVREDLKALLINRGRSFIFSTALPPPVVAAARAALAEVRAHPAWGPALQARAAHFRSRLKAEGLDTMGSESQIVPVAIGDNEATVRAGQRLRERGILAGAVRPPTVPPGTARLRLSVSLAHTEAELNEAARTIAQVVSET